MKEDIRELYEHGRDLFEKGDYEHAEGVLREVIRMNPRYADVLNKLGVMAQLKNKNEEAVTYFKQALDLNPRYTEASLNLAITYNEMGKIDEAQEVFSKVSSIAAARPGQMDPFVAGKLANEHFKLGNLYLDFCMYDDAIEEYRKAIKLRDDLSDVHTKLGIALRYREQNEDAIYHFTKAKEINPGYGPAAVQLGLTYYITGMTGLAFEEWEAALKRNPNLKEAKTYLELLSKKE